MGLGAAGTAAAIGAAGAIGSAGIGAASSSAAAGKAGAAADAASKQQLALWQFTNAQSQPFVQAGASAADQLKAANTAGWGLEGQPNYLSMAQAAMPGQMTQAELEATPGYKFNLSQGLQATQNAAAAKGLGVSGAALKGAATFATGLADSTYQNQFSNAMNRAKQFLDLNTSQQGNIQNAYSRLSGTASIGANAGAQTGSQGVTAANASGNYLTQAGNANAAGSTGIGNALTGGINSGISNYLQYQGMQAGTSPYGNTSGIYGGSAAATPPRDMSGTVTG